MTKRYRRNHSMWHTHRGHGARNRGGVHRVRRARPAVRPQGEPYLGHHDRSFYRRSSAVGSPTLNNGMMPTVAAFFGATSRASRRKQAGRGAGIPFGSTVGGPTVPTRLLRRWRRAASTCLWARWSHQWIGDEGSPGWVAGDHQAGRGRLRSRFLKVSRSLHSLAPVAARAARCFGCDQSSSSSNP